MTRGHRLFRGIEDAAPRWGPCVGDSLAGTLEEIRTIQTPWGEELVARIIRDEGGRVDVSLSPVVLKKQWQMYRPEIGDWVLIHVLHTRRSRHGHYYGGYRLYVKPSSPTTRREE